MKEFISRFITILPWLALLVLVEQFALFGAKAYVSGGSKNWIYLTMAILGYALVGFLFVQLLSKRDNLGIANSAWNVFSTILALAVGVIIFKEDNLNPKTLLGVAFGVACLVLII